MNGNRQKRGDDISRKTGVATPATIPDKQLMDYLEGTLSPEEQHELECFLSAEGMESDAIEGLRTIDAHEAKQSLHRLNRELAKSLSRKKMRRGQPVSLSGTIVATVVVLLLAVAAFCVLYFMFHKD